MSLPVTESIAPSELKARCESAVRAGHRMQMAYGWFPSGGPEAEIRYVIHAGTNEPLQVWVCRPGQEVVPSLAAITPLISWYEREVTDLCGLHFEDQPQPVPLVLLPGTVAAKPPLFPGPNTSVKYSPMPWTLPEMAWSTREDVQLLPFGPVRADVV